MGFSPIEREAWSGFLRAYAELDRLVDEDLQSHSRISHPEFEVLLRLQWEKEHRLRIQDIAAQSILTRSGVSRLVERLEKAGLVLRQKAEEDKRGFYAVLTDLGLERIKGAQQHHADFLRRRFFSRFQESELRQMTEFWKRMD